MDKPSGGSGEGAEGGGQEDSDLFNIDGSSPKHQVSNRRRSTSSSKGLQRRRSSSSSVATEMGGSETAFVIPVLSPTTSSLDHEATEGGENGLIIHTVTSIATAAGDAALPSTQDIGR